MWHIQTHCWGITRWSFGCLREFGVHAQGVVDGSAEAARHLRGLSHVQGPCAIGAAEGGGEALMSFEALRRRVIDSSRSRRFGEALHRRITWTSWYGDDGDEQMAFGAGMGL